MKVKCVFIGRKTGAIGLSYTIYTTVEVPSFDENLIRLACYDAGYEDIRYLQYHREEPTP